MNGFLSFTLWSNMARIGTMHTSDFNITMGGNLLYSSGVAALLYGIINGLIDLGGV
jgi:hypothetical protein